MDFGIASPVFLPRASFTKLISFASNRAVQLLPTLTVRMIMITARWQPDYNFLDKPDKNGQNYENITTGAVINNTMFRYGYLEAKVKPGLASVTGAFWLTGGKAELDIFELMGAPKQSHKQSKRKVWRINIIDWKSRVQTPVWKTYNDLDWEVGEAFHVYGCEWAPDHVAFFGDGKLIMIDC